MTISGTSFKPVLGDDSIKDISAVKKVIFVCGKHFYALQKEREEQVSNTVKTVSILIIFGIKFDKTK